MHTYKSKQLYYLYEKKYNSLVVGRDIVARELDIEISTLDARMKKGIGLPPFIKISDKPNGRVFTTLHDLSYFISSDTQGILSVEDRSKYLFEYLNRKYNKLIIGKKEFSSELRVSLDTLGIYMKNNSVCSYSKHTKSIKSKVSFNLIDIIDHFSNVIQTI